MANVQLLIFVILAVVTSVGRWAEFCRCRGRKSEGKFPESLCVGRLVSKNFTSDILVSRDYGTSLPENLNFTP
jgi:hypothetical protein